MERTYFSRLFKKYFGVGKSEHYHAETFIWIRIRLGTAT
ncbi:hypothetical protein [Paenibacillus sp. V4I5]